MAQREDQAGTYERLVAAVVEKSHETNRSMTRHSSIGSHEVEEDRKPSIDHR